MIALAIIIGIAAIVLIHQWWTWTDPLARLNRDVPGDRWKR